MHLLSYRPPLLKPVARPRGAARRLRALHKNQAVAERVRHGYFQRCGVIERRLQARTVVLILLGQQVLVKGGQALKVVDEHAAARRAVAVVLGKVQRDVAARDLQIRRAAFGAVLPIDAKAQPLNTQRRTPGPSGNRKCGGWV